MSDKLEPFKKILEKNGYRFTIGKRIVLNTILKSETHLNVKEIYEKVKDSNVSLATVYRTLKVFSELGIVKEININGVGFYEMKIFSGKPLHIHFRCFKCNNIFDIDSKNFNFNYLKLNKSIEEENNLQIYDSDIMLIGLCSNCNKSGKLEEENFKE